MVVMVIDVTDDDTAVGMNGNANRLIFVGKIHCYQVLRFACRKIHNIYKLLENTVVCNSSN